MGSDALAASTAPMGQRVALVARAVGATLYISLRETYHVAWLLTNESRWQKALQASGSRTAGPPVALWAAGPARIAARETRRGHPAAEDRPVRSQLTKQEDPWPFGSSP